jgi:2-amino-4-hydroxy-6-hydroxymethyldihydropteridine diphosphokinase
LRSDHGKPDPRRGGVVIALGANRQGNWGSPAQTIQRACDELRAAGLDLRSLSSLYLSAGVGPGKPQPFANAVVLGDCHLSPWALLRLLKHLERRAGRRSAMPWGPRALDLDIIDYKGLIRGWRTKRGSATALANRALVLPHARAHTRPFVMAPLAEAHPRWRHPALGRIGHALLREVVRVRAGRIMERLGPLR